MIFSQGSEIGDQRSGKKEKSGVEGWELKIGSDFAVNFGFGSPHPV
jgi:hypothetical protein